MEKKVITVISSVVFNTPDERENSSIFRVMDVGKNKNISF